MNLVLLSGNSLTNKVWVEKIADLFKTSFDQVKIQYYEHWQTGKELIDLDKELDRLIEISNKLDNYVVFAKSAGVLVTLKAIKNKKIQPKACIFVGTPVLWARHYKFTVDSWLEKYHVPTLFIQEKQDPLFSFADLQQLLKKLSVKNCTLKEVSGNTHNYPDIEELRKLTSEFLRLTK